MQTNPPMDKYNPNQPPSERFKRPQPVGMKFTMEDHQRLFTPVNRQETPSLTPGAWLAKQRGCACSRLDNQNGYGSVYQTDWSEGIEFLVIPNCPVHDPQEESK